MYGPTAQEGHDVPRVRVPPHSCDPACRSTSTRSTGEVGPTFSGPSGDVGPGGCPRGHRTGGTRRSACTGDFHRTGRPTPAVERVSMAEFAVGDQAPDRGR